MDDKAKAWGRVSAVNPDGMVDQTADALQIEAAKLLGSSIVECRIPGVGALSGQQCRDCEHFGGIGVVSPGNRNLTLKYRGACFGPMPRKLLMIEGKARVRCPLAESKVGGASRFDPILAHHCEECEFFDGFEYPRKRGLELRIGNWVLFQSKTAKAAKTAIAARCRAMKTILYTQIH